MPATLYAARYGGTRYHQGACQALTATRANGEEDQITRAGVLARGLTPCALCQPPPVVHLAIA